MFYETLAKHYDQVFPLASATLSLLDKEFQAAGVKRVLDLACGTGTYTLELARLGYESWGTDLEPGMIAQAKQKARETGLAAHFEVGNMREPEMLGMTFEGLFCIGNSLAHLPTEGDIKQALKSMRNVLDSCGVAIFQIVNYDRILARGDTALPLIENENIRFIRIYRPQNEERLVFDSILEVKEQNGGELRFKNSVELRPIRKNALETYLHAAGFSHITTYGDFKRSEYTKDSPATIMIVR